MVKQRARQKHKPPKRYRKSIPPPPEEVWVKAFVEFTGTTCVTAFCAADLGGISLTRVVEALRSGSMSWANKCDGSGSVCAFEHSTDEDVVEVVVWFEASDEKLEIREARRIIEEDDSEPNA